MGSTHRARDIFEFQRVCGHLQELPAYKRDPRVCYMVGKTRRGESRVGTGRHRDLSTALARAYPVLDH